MKIRSLVFALATLGFVSGCGSTTNAVNVEPSLDTSAPGTPGTISTQFNGQLQRTRISWVASPAADVARYQIYSYDPDPSRNEAYTAYGETTASVTTLDMPYTEITRTMYVRIRAVDTAGNVSPFTAVVPVVLQASHYDAP